MEKNEKMNVYKISIELPYQDVNQIKRTPFYSPKTHLYWQFYAVFKPFANSVKLSKPNQPTR